MVRKSCLPFDNRAPQGQKCHEHIAATGQGTEELLGNRKRCSLGDSNKSEQLAAAKPSTSASESLVGVRSSDLRCRGDPVSHLNSNAIEQVVIDSWRHRGPPNA